MSRCLRRDLESDTGFGITLSMVESDVERLIMRKHYAILFTSKNIKSLKAHRIGKIEILGK